MNTFQKYPKDWCIVAAVALTAFLAVSADGFSDLANKAFWWNFWSIIHVAAIIACVGGWIYLKGKDKQR